jgi:hypothetical protein
MPLRNSVATVRRSLSIGNIWLQPLGMAATLRLWVRHLDQPVGWRLYGERLHADVDKARQYGERWVGREKEIRRYDVERD